MMVNIDNAYSGSVWGLAGFADPVFLDGNSDYVIGIVKRLLSRIDSGVFLKCAGTEHFCYLTGEEIGVGARAANYGSEKLTEIRAVMSRDGRKLVATEWKPSEEPNVCGSLSIGVKPGFYSIETTALVGDRGG